MRLLSHLFYPSTELLLSFFLYRPSPRARLTSLYAARHIQLRGLPQTYDPKVEDPWDGLRGEGGASYWGSDPLEDVPGGTAGLKEVPELRTMLQGLLVQVGDLASG